MDEESEVKIAKIIIELADIIRKSNKHIIRRLENIDSRLEKIESKLDIVSKDTKQIPEIFQLFEIDGEEISKLRERVNNLEN